MTQEDVGRQAGCSTSYVRLLEQGFAPATSAVLPRVRAVLDAPHKDGAFPPQTRDSVVPSIAS